MSRGSEMTPEGCSLSAHKKVNKGLWWRYGDVDDDDSFVSRVAVWELRILKDLSATYVATWEPTLECHHFQFFSRNPRTGFPCETFSSITLWFWRIGKRLVEKWFSRLGKPVNKVINETNIKICLLWRTLGTGSDGRRYYEVFRVFIRNFGNICECLAKSLTLQGLLWKYVLVRSDWQQSRTVFNQFSSNKLF